MQICIDQTSLSVLNKHLNDINEMIEDGGEEPIMLTTDRVQTLVNSIITQLNAEGDNIFEEYDETL